MPKNNACLIVGDINIDFNFKTDYYPPEGGETHAQESVFRIGGSGCNTALILQKLGISTYLAANTGADMFAEFAISHIKSSGLDTQFIRKNASHPTGFFMILVTGAGQRTMFGNRGANAVPIHLSDIKMGIDQVQNVHFSGYNLLGDDQAEAMMETMAYCHQAGKTISLDPGTHTCKAVPERILEALTMVDFFLPNEIEIEILTGEKNEDKQIRKIYNTGCKTIVLKKGENGSRYTNNSADIHMPAITDKSKTIHDSTGAGDSFNAGFLSSVYNGVPTKKCLQVGNAAGFLMVCSPNGPIDLLNRPDLKSDIDHMNKKFA